MVKLTSSHQVFKVPPLINPSLLKLIKLLFVCGLFVPVSVLLLGNIFGIMREQIHFHSSLPSLLCRSDFRSWWENDAEDEEGFSREVVLFARNQRGSAPSSPLHTSLHQPSWRVGLFPFSQNETFTVVESISRQQVEVLQSIKQRTWEKQQY